MKQIQSVEFAVWGKETALDIKERFEFEAKREEFYNFTNKASLTEVHEKIQLI